MCTFIAHTCPPYIYLNLFSTHTHTHPLSSPPPSLYPIIHFYLSPTFNFSNLAPSCPSSTTKPSLASIKIIKLSGFWHVLLFHDSCWRSPQAQNYYDFRELWFDLSMNYYWGLNCWISCNHDWDFNEIRFNFSMNSWWHFSEFCHFLNYDSGFYELWLWFQLIMNVITIKISANHNSVMSIDCYCYF